MHYQVFLQVAKMQVTPSSSFKCEFTGSVTNKIEGAIPGCRHPCLIRTLPLSIPFTCSPHCRDGGGGGSPSGKLSPQSRAHLIPTILTPANHREESTSLSPASGPVPSRTVRLGVWEHGHDHFFRIKEKIQDRQNSGTWLIQGKF